MGKSICPNQRKYKALKFLKLSILPDANIRSMMVASFLS